MAASSTGTVVVAAAGLLSEHDAATHWLAGDLLAEHGSQPSDERIVEIGNVITCEGRITAMHVALLVTLRVAGPDAVALVRDRLAAGAVPHRDVSSGDAGGTSVEAVGAARAPGDHAIASSMPPT